MDFSINEGTGPLVEEIYFTDEEYNRRLNGVRKLMRQESLDVLISFTPENLYYMTGHDTPGYYFYQACVLTHDHLPINVIRKLEATNTLGRSWSRKVVGCGDEQDPIEATLWLLDELGVSTKKIGFESKTFFLTPEMYGRLRGGVEKSGGQMIACPMIIETMRMVKSEEELSCIRKGAKAVESALSAGFQVAGEGVTERDVAAIVMKELIAKGSSYGGLPPFLPTGPRASLAHSTWSDRVMQKGDWLSYEVSASINRYTCALFRSGVVGEPSDEYKRKLDASKQVLINILETAKPGVTAGEVVEAGNKGYVNAGLDDGLSHRLGYSVGISYPPDWGEGHIIDLREGSEKVLQAGMAFHGVPALIELGIGVVGISATFIVTETGTEVVTNMDRDYYIV